MIYFDSFNGMDFSITNGIIDVLIDNKIKHLCVSIGSTRLPQIIRLKEHELVYFLNFFKRNLYYTKHQLFLKALIQNMI